MAEKKKKKGHFHWTGYPNGESEQEMVDRLYREEQKKLKKDKGFYHNIKQQTLF